MEYLSRYDFDIRYIKGSTNRIADALSRYFESDAPGEVHPATDYVNADVRLDKEMDDLPAQRVIEVQGVRMAAIREEEELRDTEAKILKDNQEFDDTAQDAEVDGYNPTILESRTRGSEPLPMLLGPDDFIREVKAMSKRDALFQKILEHPNDHKGFRVIDEVVYTTNRNGEEVLCIPQGKSASGKTLRGLVLEQAHDIVGHFGEQLYRTSVKWFEKNLI
ncbi:hypothetical protein F5878DRAFT_646539 [Lentinula raphanica]|uniref:Integrase zinc-binding domain-containing protein n=1 Tax=Lentinula raphanica TaxID=153919 RepID=A0AA38NXZ8_9AGAR|nr:hypothetical protein F5878DRAFT_646539 [Lentinula raphanica]